MGLNFEKIIGDALAAARREGAEEMRERAAQWFEDIENRDRDEWWYDQIGPAIRALPLTPEGPT